MGWARGVLSGMLVVVAALALAVTAYALGGAFGFYSVIVGSPLSVADLASLAVAGGTLFLGVATALLTLSTRAAAAETRDEARAARIAARAVLSITFDKKLPVLWSTDVGYVRVMVVNEGPAMAQHVVVTLERIEPRNPMLDARYQVPNGPLINGTQVFPSTLQWKGHDKRRNLEVVCDVNPQSREYFDVLDWVWQDNSPWVLFWIDEWREAFEMAFNFDGKQPPSPLDLNTEYTLFISASAANADRIERVFKLKAFASEPHFDFGF
jgi:hypothetical protein